MCACGDLVFGILSAVHLSYFGVVFVLEKGYYTVVQVSMELST